MNRVLAFVIFYSLAHTGNANEMSSSDPINYEISGNDIYGKKGYTIEISLDRSQQHTSPYEIKVSIYDDLLIVSDEILGQVTDPAIDQIEATNDAGVFGSYFYLRIPFGKGRFFCKQKKYIYISNLAAMKGGGLEARIIDPCKKS